jgi:hypothetical protein
MGDSIAGGASKRTTIDTDTQNPRCMCDRWHDRWRFRWDMHRRIVASLLVQLLASLLELSLSHFRGVGRPTSDRDFE